MLAPTAFNDFCHSNMPTMTTSTSEEHIRRNNNDINEVKFFSHDTKESFYVDNDFTPFGDEILLKVNYFTGCILIYLLLCIRYFWTWMRQIFDKYLVVAIDGIASVKIGYYGSKEQNITKTK